MKLGHNFNQESNGEKPEANPDLSKSHPIPFWKRTGVRVAAVAILLALFIAFQPGFSEPDVEIPVPPDLEKLEPQLRAYIAEHFNAVVQSPGNAERHATLGMVYAVNDLWPEAKIAFENAASLNPKEPLAPLYAAIATQELGDLDSALERFEAVTLAFPEFAPAYYRLGELHLRTGSFQEAEAAFERLMSLAPGEWRAFAGMGDAKLRQSHFAEAARFLEQALQIDPREKSPRHLLGLAYRGLGRAEEAERELQLGLDALNYPMPDAWSVTATQHMKSLQDQFEAAIGYLEAGRPDLAIPILEKAVTWNSENILLLANLALAYHQVEEHPRARHVLHRLLQLEPDNLEAHVLLSAVLVELDQMEEALRLAERAIELSPSSPESHLAKANVFLASGRHPEALAAFDAAVEIAPDNPNIRVELGDIHLRLLHQPEPALEQYEAARKIHPASLAVQVRLADLHIRMGNPRAARAALEEARSLAPRERVIQVIEQRLQTLETHETDDSPQ